MNKVKCTHFSILPLKKKKEGNMEITIQLSNREQGEKAISSGNGDNRFFSKSKMNSPNNVFVDLLQPFLDIQIQQDNQSIKKTTKFN